MGNVCLGLVVVVVANEILDRVLGKHFAQFASKLCGKSLVVNHNQCRSLKLFNQPGCGRALSGSCSAEQNHVSFAVVDALS